MSKSICVDVVIVVAALCLNYSHITEINQTELNNLQWQFNKPKLQLGTKIHHCQFIFKRYIPVNR